MKRILGLGLIVLCFGLLLASLAFAHPKYNRKHYRHWLDADQNCRDTRQEVLARDARRDSVEWDEKGCKVIKGQWFEPYTGQFVTDPDALDVDHVVPLKWAHDHGGWKWTPDKKAAFANYLGYAWHLRAVDRYQNQTAKGARGPSDYIPPNEQVACVYAHAWTAIIVTWKLTLPEPDRLVIQGLLSKC